MVKKAILKAAAFAIIMIIIVSMLNSIFILKSTHRSKLITGLYKSSQNDYDVVLLGSSHMNGGVDPEVLWKNYGITSFNYATGGQPIDLTYYILKEILKKHKNPIVVVDLYYLGLTGKYGDNNYVENALDNLKLSKNKVDAILNCTPKSEWLNYMFPIFKYHYRYKELNNDDFYFDPMALDYEKGFGAGHSLYGQENSTDFSTTETEPIPAKTNDYLNKIIKLSKEKGFKLIFTNMPCDYSDTKGSSSWVKEPVKMFNTVAKISKDNNIPFIDFNYYTNEMNFDFKTDMQNIGHLNIFGATKVTDFLGEYLKENYKMANHHNDPEYKQWNVDYTYYTHKEAANELSVHADIESYIPLLKNQDYTIFVLSNNAETEKNSPIQNFFSQLGLKIGNEDNKGTNYLAILDNNKVQRENFSNSVLSKELIYDKDTKFYLTTESSDNSLPSLLYNGNEQLGKRSGLNLIVYDKLLKTIVDNIYITSSGEIER